MSRAAQARLRCTAHALIKQTDSSTDAAGTQPRETEAEAGDGAGEAKGEGAVTRARGLSEAGGPVTR